MGDIDTRTIIQMFERSDIDIYNSAGGAEGFAKTFDTDLLNGISKSEAASDYKDRIENFGTNTLPDPPTKTWFQFYIHTFKDVTLQILGACIILSLALELGFHHDHITIHNFLDAISITIALLLVSCVTAQTNYAQQKTYLEINKLKNNYSCTVVRAGERQQVGSTEVLVGDVLEIKAGDAVAADAVLINGTNLTINNSAQTGEPIAVKINESNPFLRGGGAIESGIGTCLVCAVGKNSQYGVTMTQITELQAEEEETPLQKKLNRLARILLFVAIGLAAATFIILMIQWIISITKASKNNEDLTPYYTDLSNRIITTVIIFLCCVPEGLPLAVTLSLSFSMKQMMKDQNFVRHLSACETMGGATTICSDKTGTLTQNKMTVVKFYMDQKSQDVGPDMEVDTDIKALVAEGIAVNSTASHTIKEGTEEIIFVGSSSECALLNFISPWGHDYLSIRELNPYIVLNEFNSARKRMSTIIEKENGGRLYLKGAPDFCLPFCTKYLTPENEVMEIDDDFKQRLMDTVNDFASQAYRTLLLAYRDIDGEKTPEWEDAEWAENDLTFIALVGIQDPLRPEVPDAIKNCENAGVIVRMVTGDFIATARAISKQCGIIKSDTDIVMEGQEFASMSKIELLDKIDDLRVLARSSPTDKYRLVTLLMECGEVVAVTGDGSNDSAALKKANVGFSMGICGTELAKIASDIVILDDNFKSIVSALKWGRCIYDNIRCFLTFQIPVNMVAVAVSIIGTLKDNISPLKPIQILWMNLINDSLGALALATRPPTENLLMRKPYGESDGIISNVVLRNIIIQSVYQIAAMIFVLFAGVPLIKVESQVHVHSFMFNMFVYMNVFNLINSRKASNDGSIWEGFLKNPYFIGIFLFLGLMQIPIMLVGGSVFYTYAPSWQEWVITLGLSLFSLVLGYLYNLWDMPDHTLDNLNAYRQLRKSQVRAYYSQFSKEEQWDDKNLLKNPDEITVNIKEEVEDKKSTKPVKEDKEEEPKKDIEGEE